MHCGARADSPSAPGGGVLVNARIHTLSEAQPVAEALAWDAAGRIVAVGTREEVLGKAAGATLHDAKGATVVPGLIDAHAHLMGLGMALMSADLVGARSRDEVIARLQEFAERLPPDACRQSGNSRHAPRQAVREHAEGAALRTAGCDSRDRRSRQPSGAG
jgi:predicted amidohydrolase YtcJ